MEPLPLVTLAWGDDSIGDSDTSTTPKSASPYKVRVRNTFIEVVHGNDSGSESTWRNRAHSDPGDRTADEIEEMKRVVDTPCISDINTGQEADDNFTDDNTGSIVTDDLRASDASEYEKWHGLDRYVNPNSFVSAGPMSDSCTSGSGYQNPAPVIVPPRQWPGKRDVVAKPSRSSQKHARLSRQDNVNNSWPMQSQRGSFSDSSSGTVSSSVSSLMSASSHNCVSPAHANSSSTSVDDLQHADFSANFIDDRRPGWEATERAAMKAATKIQKDRVENAIRLIEEIPVRVDALLEKAQTDLLQNIQGNMEEAYEMVREDLDRGRGGGQKDVSLENLSFIPQIVSTTFGKKRHAVMGIVNKKINSVVWQLQHQQKMEHPASNSTKAMERLPKHVKKVATDVVEEVVQSSRTVALQQFRYAVTEIPENQRPPKGIERKMQNQLMRTIPEELPHVTEAVEAITNQQVEHALASIHSIRNSVPNQAVAQAILEAKCAAEEQKRWQAQKPSASSISSHNLTEVQALSTISQNPSAISVSHRQQDDTDWKCGDPIACQPCDTYSDSELIPSLHSSKGSFGHPHSCWRPCLYYRKGECISGKNCNFCHCVHLKRTPRFDKRHREELRKMSLYQLSEIAIPILVQKIEFMGIELDEGSSDVKALQEEYRIKANRSFYNRFRSVLESMTGPKILTLIKKKIAEDWCFICKRSTSTPTNPHCASCRRTRRLLQVMPVFETYYKRRAPNDSKSTDKRSRSI